MIGMCSVTFGDKTPEEVIEIAKEAKLETIEWWGRNHVPAGDIQQAEKVRQLTEEAGLTVSSYGSYYKVGSGESFQDVLKTAEALGTEVIRIWAGEKGSKETSAEEFQKIVEETCRLARMAQNEQMTLHFEYHADTLTDTPESAQRLMESIIEPNVYLYWQPNELLTSEERTESLKELGKWVTNVHVFHWTDFYHRFELQEGYGDWKSYLNSLKQNSRNSHNFLLEFVKDNNPKQLVKDAGTLRQLLNEVDF